MKTSLSRRGFTVIELVVVVSILAILSGVLVPRVSNHIKATRDARRLTDIKVLRDAIDQFYLDRGTYPQANENSIFGNWDVSHDGNFIRSLRNSGYLEEELADPLNDTLHHYRYLVYEPGSHGCKGAGPFYVLGLTNFETAEFAAKHKGFFRCANRNWGDDFAYVTGGGAAFRE